MIASAPDDFTKMVNMGMRLEQGVREGRLSKEEASSSKKYGGSFSKRKEGETNSLSVGRQGRPHVSKSSQPRQHQHLSIPEPLPRWFKLEVHCAFHQGAPGHDIENCYPLKSLVEMYRTLCLISDCEHDHDGCAICSMNPRGYMVVKRDIQKLMDENVIQIQQSRDIDDVNVIVFVFKTPERVVIQFDSNNNNNVNRSVSMLVIQLAGPIPYASDKVMPYQYNATMVENGQEVPLLVADSMVNIADIVKVTHSGRVFGLVFPKEVEDAAVSKKADIPVVNPDSALVCQSGESSKLKTNDNDEVLKLIKRSEFNVVEQLLQTPSKIFVLSLLMNSEAHKEALQKVLE
ncbi:hypothetical protein KIW84_010536 [Lathyrus oleraceus]|uniref:Uncharacterized protein n=1 Tax=Pisum sativum TaxID=3888 RepID=A0A9D4YMD5_PEA|nr:hypothetical protein KIW84_010536 [Pisum sativum]